MNIKSQKDFITGLLFMVIGIAFAWGSLNYNVGTGARMGPGYFPRMVGVLLAVLGAIVSLQALTGPDRGGDKVGAIAWKPLFFIILSNLAFVVMLVGLPSIGLPSMGLMVAIVVLTLIAGLAGEEFRLREALVLSVVLAVTSYLAFIVLLKLQFPVWPAFLRA